MMRPSQYHSKFPACYIFYNCLPIPEIPRPRVFDYWAIYDVFEYDLALDIMCTEQWWRQ